MAEWSGYVTQWNARPGNGLLRCACNDSEIAGWVSHGSRECASDDIFHVTYRLVNEDGGLRCANPPYEFWPLIPLLSRD
jgi:hypothetical protein